MKLIKVDGFDGLARDTQTGSIVNINTSEIERARLRKRLRQEQKQKETEIRNDQQLLKQKVDGLENKLNEILALLQQQKK